MANRSRLFLAMCCLMVVGLAGCATLPKWTGISKEQADETWLMMQYPHAKMATLTMTSEEHFQRITEVARRDRRGLRDDLDLLFMTDRPTRLTRWHDR